ncbi:hypothetical protein COLO4_11372 [Corchorus olitorius]|uniref:TF-B3 domain-containing protein n=1 Tax=Corchorus olitorius TaxID=93759 RepID=A0A1R3K4P6_9ROSI|nr:hypothetical protein COLO4_11372 [Corchorus olitorius]
MAPPDQKSNACPMFTNEQPQFFKIILQKTLQDGKLEIPKMFIRKYGNDMSSPALLKVPSGDVWRVELRKRDGKVWFKNGWQEFSNHYSLDEGHFVVFRYEGYCNFHVIIIDSTGTEIDYPYIKNDHEQLKEIPDESEDDDSIEIIEEINLESESLAPQAMHNGVAAMKVHERTGSSSRTQKLKADKKLLALERAERAFQSENPFFMLVMQPSYVDLTPRCKVTLPADFVWEHLMKGNCEITLSNSDGKTWPVKLYQGQSGKVVYAMLQNGWPTFVQDNKLEVGDVCAFELTEDNETSFNLKVTIFKKQAVEDSSRP